MQPTVFNTDLSSQAIEVLLLKKFLTLSYTFYPLARLNSHDLRESRRVHGGKAAEDMRADVQRKCLWSSLKNSRERVNSVWTLQLLDHENLQQRCCLIIPKQNKREQLQGAVLTHWDTEKKRREWQKKQGARHLSSNWSQNPKSLSASTKQEHSLCKSQCFLAQWKGFVWKRDVWEQWWKNTKGFYCGYMWPVLSTTKPTFTAKAWFQRRFSVYIGLWR